jgi:hypothetical protein
LSGERESITLSVFYLTALRSFKIKLAKKCRADFSGVGALSFSAADKSEKSKILGRQQGVPQKNRGERWLFRAQRRLFDVGRAEFGC